MQRFRGAGDAGSAGLHVRLVAIARAQDIAGGGADGRAVLTHFIVQLARQRATFLFLRTQQALRERAVLRQQQGHLASAPDGKAGQYQHQQQQAQGQFIELPVLLAPEDARQPFGQVQPGGQQEKSQRQRAARDAVPGRPRA